MSSITTARLHLAWLQAACLLLSCPAAANPHAQPLGGGGSRVLEPAPPADPPRQQRKVYVCRDGGAPMFTDRPCGPSAAIHAIDYVTPGAGSSPSLSPPAPSASTRPRVMPAPATAVMTHEQARCTVLRERLAAIDDQMRSGYSAREAARLWQRWRDARAQLRAQRC